MATILALEKVSHLNGSGDMLPFDVNGKLVIGSSKFAKVTRSFYGGSMNLLVFGEIASSVEGVGAEAAGIGRLFRRRRS